MATSMHCARAQGMLYMVCDAHSGKKNMDPDAQQSTSSGRKCGQIVVAGFARALKSLLPPLPGAISEKGEGGKGKGAIQLPLINV